MVFTYPRLLDLGNASQLLFKVPETNSERFFNASNFSTSPTTHLLDLTSGVRYEVDHNSSTGAVRTNIQSGPERRMFVGTASSTSSISSQELLPAGNNGQFTDPTSIGTESAYIIISNRKLWSSAQEYAAYRDGTHDAVLVDIENLYDQFAYGIRKHPLAIRGFIMHAMAEWPSPPKFLLLLGKSIQEPSLRGQGNSNAAEYANRSLVPSMGFPVSDNLITAGLGSKFYVASVPTGRIAARNNAEVSLYLQKIKELERSMSTSINPYTLDNRRWQKRILHFAGGNNSTENKRFKGYLSGYKAYIEDSLFAGDVTLFSKTSGSVIEQLNTDSLRALVKDGAAIMTFFGHASGNSFDLSVDDPSLWENKGRYPVVLANSCFSGNIHLPVDALPSISEQFVLTPEEGAIAFVATPDLSYESTLNRYTTRLYEQIAKDGYTLTLGEQMQNASDQMATAESEAGMAIEMTLHGDPALTIYPHPTSELTINDPIHKAAISIGPEIITSDVDSITVVVDITNLGRSSEEAFNVTCRRYLADGNLDEEKVITAQGIDYNKKVEFKFFTNRTNSLGSNSIEVEVDQPLSLITEFIELQNNVTGRIDFFITTSDVYPVIPYEHAVIPDLEQVLKANTGYPLLESNTYLFEVDTTDKFSSPAMQSGEVTGAGSVLEWEPNLASLATQDSTVFYWRVTPKSDLSKWRTSSFQVINGEYGWGQADYFQYNDNEKDLLLANDSKRTLEFDESDRELFVQVIGNPTPNEYNDNFYTLDGQGAPLGEYGVASTKPGIAVVVIDSVELRPWGTYGIGESGQMENVDHQFGNNNNGTAHRSRVEYFFTFTADTSQVQLNSMINMIQNEVENGQFLLVYTQLKGQFDDASIWTSAHLDYLESIGADSIRLVGNENPYIFFVKKGYPTTSREIIGTDPNDIVNLQVVLESNFKLGNLESPMIGPGTNWSSFHLSTRSIENPSSDSVNVTLTGVSSDLKESEHLSVTTNGSYLLDPQASDSIQSMKLGMHTEDNVDFTPKQLKSWHVLFDPAPDAAINPSRGKTTDQQRISAGKDLNFGLAVENISEFDFEEIRVHYWLTDEKGGLVQEHWLTYDGFASEEVIFDSVSFETKSLNGSFTMNMEVNPIDEEWQLEQYHFNNRAYQSIQIEADNKNPLLDVTFDGVHILNGDIVSPTPEIVLELKDENEILLMEDTTSFDVFILYPDGTQNRVPFFSAGTEVLQFEPATTSENKARITYIPEGFSDGTHTLMVQGRDASGNSSGPDSYKIEFEVINQSMVTHVMNYPNPFSTSTQFVFTLTGSRVPEVFTIQIMTISGKVVREITRAELGAIHIGRNITDYTWDGTDEYGDRLANGVYLYRVNTKIEGDKVDKMATGADQYFKKEFGKMYLFR